MSEEVNTVWVLTGESESGDDYGPEVFSYAPSSKELKKIALSWDGDEDEDGCGDYGSYVYLQVTKTTVRE